MAVDHVNDGIVKCEGCGALGKRRPGHPCPDFWFYLESINRTKSNGRGGGSVYVLWACSQPCRDGLWKKGPGPNEIDESASQRDRDQMAKEAS